jgi:RNA 3'-terminal phosphate cyclase (ATP)
MLTIDGATGEGGGQVLRTALALSMVTGTAFRIVNIRATRKRPGLMHQHLAAVNAAARICSARVEGAGLDSGELQFAPGEVAGGEYAFSIGTAGSTILLVQTVLPALLLAPEPSTVLVEGGTHNPLAPSFEFFDLAFVPLLRAMGARVKARLERPGFYPAGGGRVLVHIAPTRRLKPIQLQRRGAVRQIRATAMIAQLPEHIARRELDVIAQELSLEDPRLEIVRATTATGAGNALNLIIESQNATEVVSAVGTRGLRAERVAEDVARRARRYLDANVPVGEHLADQLLLPMALARGGTFRTLLPSRHLSTNARVLEQFSGIRVVFQTCGPDCCTVSLSR